MIVGTKEIDLAELRNNISNIDTLERYCRKIVPRYLWHIPEIMNNQKYLVAMYLRELKSVPFKRRESLNSKLLKDVSISGRIDTVIEFNDLLEVADHEKLKEYIKSLMEERYELH